MRQTSPTLGERVRTEVRSWPGTPARCCSSLRLPFKLRKQLRLISAETSTDRLPSTERACQRRRRTSRLLLSNVCCSPEARHLASTLSERSVHASLRLRGLNYFQSFHNWQNLGA